MSPKIFCWLLLLMSFCAFNLGGCSSNCCPPTPCTTCCKPVPKDTRPRWCRCVKWTWEQRFKARNVQLIQVGDDIKFVLPSECFFLDNTAALNSKSYPSLDMIASFICGLEKMNLKVAGYTDCEDCHIRNIALSRQQAQVIADYLWKRGVDARVLYAVGYGECVPIACNSTCKGRALNRRVEITVRKITDDYDT